MDITIHSSLPPAQRPGGLAGLYRDTLGFEVRNEVGYNGMRWMTVGPTEQPYGVRDCAVRDPAGNLIRINELR